MTATYLSWIFPDRGSSKETRHDEERFWSGYRRVAAEFGLTLEVCGPELIDVSVRPGYGTVVRVDGRVATPQDTIFVTEYQAFPHMVKDAWWQIITFQSLEAAGFYLPIPPRWSAIANDKIASLQVIGPHLTATTILPTVRVNAGRDLLERDITELLAEIPLPAVIKPSSWGTMNGLLEARDPVELNSGLSLASAADMSMVVQPRIPTETLHTYKLLCVDREVLGARRYSPGADHVLVGPRHGGQAGWADPPTAILTDAAAILELIPTPFLCIDFLADGDQYYFSEVELDASIGVQLLTDPTMLEVLRRRFKAYLRDHQAWIESKDH